MKLVIRDKKPQPDEETIELWMEENSNGEVMVRSRKGEGSIYAEVHFRPDGIKHNFYHSNFRKDND